MKTVPSSADASIDGLYRIATVSHLTGIPVQTIRVWESRYTVVQPTRSSGNVRLYRRADIARLSLVKAAVDAGQAISTVAALTDRQLKARFKDAPPAATTARTTGCRVLVCGSALASVLKTAWKARSDVRVQASLPTIADTELASLPSVDAVIVDVPANVMLFAGAPTVSSLTIVVPATGVVTFDAVIPAASALDGAASNIAETDTASTS